jgi:putative ABC transport system permease protein
MNLVSNIGFLLMTAARSLRHHALSSAVTIVSAALAAGLVVSVFCIQSQTEIAFKGGALGFDAVLGARGSREQLVFNAVFHMDVSPGNITWEMYEQIKARPGIKTAIPYAVGDNYRGYRIIGTTQAIFEGFEYVRGKPFAFEPGGRAFDERYAEAVVGSFVAQKLGLKVGDKITPYHGMTFAERARHQREFVIVGIMKPTNTPVDRVVYLPIEGVFRLGGEAGVHVLRGTGESYVAREGVPIPDEHKEVSAVLLEYASPAVGFQLDQFINRQGRVATLAPIGPVVTAIFEKIGWMHTVLTFIAYMIVAVAGGGILASIYNSINERRREFAILRALGARKRMVFSSIVVEACSIALVGAVLGYAVYLAILGVVAYYVRKETGIVLTLFYWHPSLFWTPIGMAAVGALAGVIPAVKAYATDVATNLAPAS